MSKQIIYQLLLIILSVIIKNVASVVLCGKPMCFSSNVVKPGEPLNISWHKMDITNKIQISILYGDTSFINDCHILDDQTPLLHWTIDNKSDEFSATIDSVNFEIENKQFIVLLNYLATDICMMGPEGSGDSFFTFDKSMPIVRNNTNENGGNVNNDDDNKENGNGDNNGKDVNSKGEKDNNKSNSSILITIFILSLVAILMAIILLILYNRKGRKNREKNENKSSAIKLPTDDDFNEGSVYSAVNVNNVIPPLPNSSANDSFAHNVSVESFNSATSKSGLISRHEAKMIAERFRHELQNPLNNEVEEVSSIKGKEEV